MIKTHKQCDKCKTESTEDDFKLFEITLNLRQVQPAATGQSKIFPMQHWCEECVTTSALKGINEKQMEERRQASAAPIVPATFEDLLREIAYEVACDAISDNSGH
jgi:hypothetical protein